MENATIVKKKKSQIIFLVRSEEPDVGWCEGRLGIVQPQEEEDEDGFSVSRDSLDLADAQHNYQDLD